MKNVGVYKYNINTFEKLESVLEEFDIKLVQLKDNEQRADIDLYIFNVDTPEELGKINFALPFVIISSLNASEYLLKSRKIGAKDYISKPFIDISSIAKRIQRSLKQNTDKNSKAIISRTMGKKIFLVSDQEIDCIVVGGYDEIKMDVFIFIGVQRAKLLNIGGSKMTFGVHIFNIYGKIFFRGGKGVADAL